MAGNWAKFVHYRWDLDASKLTVFAPETQTRISWQIFYEGRKISFVGS